MPTDPSRATRAQRTLASELSRLRAKAGLSLRQLGHGVIPHARVDRIESAKATPTRDQVLHWLTITAADDVTRERVLGVFEEVHAQAQPWSALLDDSPTRTLQAIAAAREEASNRVDEFCQQWLPGLLQTAAYARALFLVLRDLEFDIDVEVGSDMRMRRQEILHGADRSFRFLITRRALAWNPDPGTVSMPAQVDRLRELASLRSTEIRVLDDAAAPLAGWSSFTVYDGESPFVSMELEHRPMQVFDAADVAVYRRRFEQMWTAAVPLA